MLTHIHSTLSLELQTIFFHYKTNTKVYFICHFIFIIYNFIYFQHNKNTIQSGSTIGLMKGPNSST